MHSRGKYENNCISNSMKSMMSSGNDEQTQSKKKIEKKTEEKS
jgi:hypothetical protein